MLHRILSFRTPAIIHHHHASEYHGSGQYLLPTQCIHSHPNADDDGNDGLHIAVHTHQGGADAFLSQRDEEVGDEGGADDEERQFRQIGARQQTVIEGNQFVYRQRQRECGGIQEYPLHKRDDRILGDDGLEQSQIKGETKAVGNHQQDAVEACLCSTSRSCKAVHYQIDNAEVCVMSYDFCSNATICILDASGQTMDCFASSLSSMQVVSFDINGYPNGTYTLVISTPQGTYLTGVFEVDL